MLTIKNIKDMKYIKEIGVSVTALLLIVGVGYALTIEGTPEEVQELLSKPQTELQDVGGAYFVTEEVFLLNQSSTSTMAVATQTAGAASSTLAFNCDGVDQMDLELMVLPAGATTKYQWTLAFTNDKITDVYSATSTANEAWFYEDGYTVDSAISVTHGAGPIIHNWTPGTVTTSTKNITITPVAAKFCRVDISTAAANGGLWAAVVLKKAY